MAVMARWRKVAVSSRLLPDGGDRHDGYHAAGATGSTSAAFLPEERGDAARAAAGHAAERVPGQHAAERRPRVAALGRDPRPAAAHVLPAPHAAFPGLAPCLPLLLRALAQGLRADGHPAVVGLDVLLVAPGGLPGLLQRRPGRRRAQPAGRRADQRPGPAAGRPGRARPQLPEP